MVELIKLGFQARSAKNGIEKTLRVGRPSKEADPREKILGIRPL
jgi:hypothetical protein